MSSSPRLLAGRNLTLGKPAHYVRLILSFLCISQSWKVNVFGSSDVCNFCNFPSGKEGD